MAVPAGLRTYREHSVLVDVALAGCVVLDTGACQFDVVPAFQTVPAVRPASSLGSVSPMMVSAARIAIPGMVCTRDVDEPAVLSEECAGAYPSSGDALPSAVPAQVHTWVGSMTRTARLTAMASACP